MLFPPHRNLFLFFPSPVFPLFPPLFFSSLFFSFPLFPLFFPMSDFAPFFDCISLEIFFFLPENNHALADLPTLLGTLPFRALVPLPESASPGLRSLSLRDDHTVLNEMKHGLFVLIPCVSPLLRFPLRQASSEPPSPSIPRFPFCPTGGARTKKRYNFFDPYFRAPSTCEPQTPGGSQPAPPGLKKPAPRLFYPGPIDFFSVVSREVGDFFLQSCVLMCMFKCYGTRTPPYPPRFPPLLRYVPRFTQGLCLFRLIIEAMQFFNLEPSSSYFFTFVAYVFI